MLELRILTGLHRGAALPLDGDTIRLGSAAENDIVLLDPGMPALACTICQSADSTWRYRPCALSQSADAQFDEANPSDGTLLVAGARWFAGPVLIGCDEEASPWPSWQTQHDIEPPAARDRRSISFKATLYIALATAIGLAGIAAVLALRGTPAGLVPSHADTPPVPPTKLAKLAKPTKPTKPAKPTLAMASAPIRIVNGTVYPDQAVGRPPFAIRSVSTGPYGFVVTRDNQVLIPGSRRGAFTLVRIEPGRAVFSGPYAAELTW